MTENRDNKCIKDNKLVLVRDCEECQTNRQCPPLCFKRGLIFGMKDNEIPLWAFTIKEAEKSKEDVSFYYTEDRQEQISVTIKIKELIPAEIRWRIWERDNFTCKHCKTRKHLTIDHIIPESKGGKLVDSNLQTLCRRCNSKKGVKI